MPNNKFLDDLNILNKGFKSLLENEYGKEYITSNKESDTSSVSDILTYFSIQNSSVVICDDITSPETLDKIKNKIMTGYEKFTLDIIDYYGRISTQLDDQTSKSISIIAKTFKARKKKLDAAFKRFTIQDHWGVTQLGREFESILIKFLSDLIESIIHSISVGIKEKAVSSVYQHLLKMFNCYLSQLGVYTTHYDVGHKLSEDDWSVLNPIDSDDCDTSDGSLKDVIKNIYYYPYFIGENTLILEGNVILWRVI
jgi:hypothetical protein